MQGLKMPPKYPLLRKLSDNACQQNKEENQERGRHEIQEIGIQPQRLVKGIPRLRAVRQV
jgi:hypothetical protein